MTIEETNIAKPVNAAWIKKYTSKLVSADDAVRVIKSGDNVVIQPGCAAPMELIRAMVNRKDDLMGVNIYHILIYWRILI